MISNSQPWDNLKFDRDGVDEVRRQVLRHALQHLLVLRPLRQCGRFYGTGAGSSDERTPGDRPLDHLPAQYAGPERHRIARELRSDAGGPYDPGIRMRKPVELVRAPQPQAVLGRRSDTRQTGMPARRSTPVWKPFRCSPHRSRRSSPTVSSAI